MLLLFNDRESDIYQHVNAYILYIVQPYVLFRKGYRILNRTRPISFFRNNRLQDPQ